MKTLKDWFKENLSDSAKDLAQYGASSGFSGIIYYKETTALYNEYTEEIWDMLEEDRESIGHKTILELIASFNGAKDVGSDEQLKNLLVWYACERLAQEEVDRLEEEAQC